MPSDPGRIAQLLFHVDRRIGIGSGFMPPSLLAWAEPHGLPSDFQINAVAVGYSAIWAGGQDASGSALLYYSTNGGRNWRNATSRLPDTTNPITAIGANPGSQYIYIGTSGGDLWKSSNHGETFSSGGAGLGSNRVRAIAFAHPSKAWVAADGPTLKFTDHSTWTDRTSALGWSSGCIIYALCQKPQNYEAVLVAGTDPLGPTGKLSYTDNNSTFYDRSSLMASATEYHAIGYSQIDDRFLIAGIDGTDSKVVASTDNGASGEEIDGLTDSGGTSFRALHCVLDTWAVIKSDGSVFRVVQDRSGLVRLADEVSETVGVHRAYGNAYALAYDPSLNRYFLAGADYLLYTDDIAQVGAYMTRALPPGNAIIGQVYIAPCKYMAINTALGTLIKSGPGKLVGFLITSVNNNAHDVDFYDGTSTSGTHIVKVRVNPSTYGPDPISVWPAHPIEFQNGLYIYVGHGNTRCLVAYM